LRVSSRELLSPVTEENYFMYRRAAPWVRWGGVMDCQTMPVLILRGRLNKHWETKSVNTPPDAIGSEKESSLDLF